MGGLRRVCERCVQVRFGLVVRVADAIFAWQAKILRCALLPRPAERVVSRANGGRRLFSYGWFRSEIPLVQQRCAQTINPSVKNTSGLKNQAHFILGLLFIFASI